MPSKSYMFLSRASVLLFFIILSDETNAEEGLSEIKSPARNKVTREKRSQIAQVTLLEFQSFVKSRLDEPESEAAVEKRSGNLKEEYPRVFYSSDLRGARKRRSEPSSFLAGGNWVYFSSTNSRYFGSGHKLPREKRNTQNPAQFTRMNNEFDPRRSGSGGRSKRRISPAVKKRLKKWHGRKRRNAMEIPNKEGSDEDVPYIDKGVGLEIRMERESKWRMKLNQLTFSDEISPGIIGRFHQSSISRK